MAIFMRWFRKNLEIQPSNFEISRNSAYKFSRLYFGHNPGYK